MSESWDKGEVPRGASLIIGFVGDDTVAAEATRREPGTETPPAAHQFVVETEKPLRSQAGSIFSTQTPRSTVVKTQAEVPKITLMRIKKTTRFSMPNASMLRRPKTLPLRSATRIHRATTTWENAAKIRSARISADKLGNQSRNPASSSESC